MAVLGLYSIFHLNLAYSSIPESRRAEVIERCFWPLLRLATEEAVPVAVEAPAYTLELAADLSPSWVSTLRHAVASGIVELVGSGYAQLIGPLVPADVNRWNLDTGTMVYERLLGVVPRVWYVNEQAYSRGMVEHYAAMGAAAIVMEWNNPRTLHPEWHEEYRYHPQRVLGNGAEVPLIWNDSIAFQKFQRYAHDEITREELLRFLALHRSRERRYFCLYGNDAEIFDFRPGRFGTEPAPVGESEWSRITQLYLHLKRDRRVQLVRPSDVLGDSPSEVCHQGLVLESPSEPIPVKKQPKYNVSRWAVTGRDSLWLNTACHALLRQVIGAGDEPSEEIKKEVCYVWSSDFRTHITQERWDALVRRLAAARAKFGRKEGHRGDSPAATQTVRVNGLEGSVAAPGEKVKAPTDKGLKGTRIEEKGRFLRVSTPEVLIELNVRRGLAIGRLVFPSISREPLCGTIPHGYFEDIALSADWYTGGTVLQRSGKPQVTDLGPVRHERTLEGENGAAALVIQGAVDTGSGPIRKTIRIYRDTPQVDLEYAFDWEVIPLGSFRTGFITLLPGSFDRSSLFYATHNGGKRWEVFPLQGRKVAHGAPGSSVVTASSGLGATEGMVVMGDRAKGLVVWFDQQRCAAMPMVAYREAAPSFFARIMFSCGEMDESRVGEVPGPLRFVTRIAGLRKQAAETRVFLRK